MDWELELLFVARAVAAALLGGLMGWERETHASDAGIRTYASVALGACVVALISQHIANGDPARIAAQVVSGVGFLGAGAILRHDSGVPRPHHRWHDLDNGPRRPRHGLRHVCPGHAHCSDRGRIAACPRPSVVAAVEAWAPSQRPRGHRVSEA